MCEGCSEISAGLTEKEGTIFYTKKKLKAMLEWSGSDQEVMDNVL